MTSNRPDIRPQLGLRSVINVSGTMTSLGASIVVPEAVQMVEGVLTEFVEINELHRRASEAITLVQPHDLASRPARSAMLS